MKKIKHSKKPPEVVYSVGRYVFAYYDDKRLRYGYSLSLGISSQVIKEVQGEMGLMECPAGFSGGPVEDVTATKAFLTQLLSHSRVLGSRFDPEKLRMKVRYHVTIGGTITCDNPPKDQTGQLDYSQSEGYKTLYLAHAAAQSFFNYYEKWLRDSKNKPSQPVKLVLHDKEGNIILKKFNNYKP